MLVGERSSIELKDIAAEEKILKETNPDLLLKMERILELDDLVEGWSERYSKSKSLREWYGLLGQVDDTMLQKLCGSDAALYLVYLRYSSVFFSVIAAVNLIFIIFFMTGTPLSIDNFREHTDSTYAMQALTILNITDTNWKVFLCFLNTMVTVAAMCFHLIVSYTNKFKDNESFMRENIQQLGEQEEGGLRASINSEQEGSHMSEIQLSQHTVMISHIE